MHLERLLGALAMLSASVCALTGCMHASALPVTSPEQLTVVVEPTAGTEACCGVIVAPMFVVTAAHCLRAQPARWLRLRDSSAGVLEARLASIDTGTDLALLRTRRDLSSSAQLRDGRLDPSEPLSSVHPSSDRFSTDNTRGQKLRRVSTRIVDPDWLHWMLIDLPLRQGTSGSGIWDRAGRLTGIVLRRRNGLVEVAPTAQIEELVALSGVGAPRRPAETHAPTDPSVGLSEFPLTPNDLAAQILMR